MRLIDPGATIRAILNPKSGKTEAKPLPR